MANMKPSLAKGTRDFSPTEMHNRNFIFDTVKAVFKKFGYQQIETPSFENLATLTGKYGDEGDKLIFKILNSGDYLAKTPENLLKDRNSTALIQNISEKALRYDLTVPFARYVVMHQNDITFPFKRFQIQPVWRADRPQKGRYREFYQCDVDVVGDESLLNEAEFILIYDEALSNLGLKDFTIKINNRKILSGIAEIIEKPNLLIPMTVAIDKLDKIGLEGVNKELLQNGFSEQDIATLKPIIELNGDNNEKLQSITKTLQNSEIGNKGIKEIQTVLNYLTHFKLQNAKIEIDITLARGLNYYTGCIFEVKTNETEMGSIGGGGRYDDLTGMFGLSNLTGVGVSFGADRIYDVLHTLQLFPQSKAIGTQVLICTFDQSAEKHALPILQQLRHSNIATELYPSGAKIKKQMNYAHQKNIPWVIIIGDNEIASNSVTLKNMENGNQNQINISDIINHLK